MIPYSRQNISAKDIQAVTRVMQSDFLTQGPEAGKFEDSLSEKFSVNHAVVCSSGTAALHLAYASLRISDPLVGIVPAISFSATANAIHYLGGKVVFCDVDPHTGLICPNSLSEILNDLADKDASPGLIAPVSFAGAVAPLPEIYRLSRNKGWRIVEDAAHSPGAFASDSDGKKYSSGNCKFSDASCLSFHPVKHICCGEGGAVLTNDDGLANLMKNERSHGIVRPYGADHDTPWFYEQRELGWNYRLTDIQAALGSSQLNSLDEQLQERRNLADRYHHYLSLPPFDGFLSPPSPSPGHAWHLYIIRFLEPGVRDAAHKFLKDKGIMTQVHYVPIYRHPYYERIHGKIHLPGAEKFYHSCLSIPLFPTLKEEEQDRVIHELKNFLQSR